MTKDDKEFIQSQSHPDLANTTAPRTLSASGGNTRRRKHCTSQEKVNKRQAKEKHLDSLSVGEILLGNNILTCDELLALCLSQFHLGSSPRGQPPGISSKTCPRGRDLTFKSCLGPGIRQGPGFCENESETSKNCMDKIFTGENKKQVKFLTIFEVYVFS